MPKKECWRTEELCPKKRETNKAMHDESFLSSWLGMGVEGKAEERETVNSEAKEEEYKRESREKRNGWLWFENGLVVDFPPVMNVRVLEKGLEQEVVDVSGDESEHWCEVSVCVLVSVPHVLELISPANLVCDRIFHRFLSLIVKLLNRRPFLSPASVTPVLRWSVMQR